MRQKLWKSVRLVAGAEAIMIFFMIFMGVMAFRLELERERSEYEMFMQDVMNWEYDMKRQNMEPYKYYIYDILNTARNGRQYGVAMRLMDRYGETISETKGMNQILLWESDVLKKNELLQLDEYFSEEAIDQMISRYYEYNNDDDESSGRMEIQKIQGYYDNDDRFVPVEIVLGDKTRRTETYSMTNEEAKQRIGAGRLFWRFAKNTGYGYTRGLAETANEYGLIYASFNGAERTCNKRALDKLDAEEVAYGGTQIMPGVEIYESPLKVLDGRSEIQSYRLSFYADLTSITLHSYAFRKDLILIILFCQLAGTVITASVILSNKRKFRLQQMQNTFINAMAHEMKTPAAVMKSGIECIREKINPEKQDHYMELISREADHMSELLNAMLLYTKVADTGYHLKKERVCMSGICEKIRDHYQTMFNDKQIMFEIDEQAPFWITGDPYLLEMVVDNFFSNAVRHCPHGEKIRLTIGQSSLSIFNAGVHIPGGEQERIWEPLYQVDKARSGDNSSSGMGLAISSQILKLHHMKYGVRNVQDGVEFFFGL